MINIDVNTKAIVAATLTAALLGKDPHTVYSPKYAVSQFHTVLAELEESLIKPEDNTLQKAVSVNEIGA